MCFHCRHRPAAQLLNTSLTVARSPIAGPYFSGMSLRLPNPSGRASCATLSVPLMRDAVAIHAGGELMFCDTASGADWFRPESP